MRKDSVMEANLGILKAMSVLGGINQLERLYERVIEEGITQEEMSKVMAFTNTLDSELFSEYTIQDSLNTYVESVKKLSKYADMAKGYEEMGELNLQLSNEYFSLENEGEKLNEMGKGEEQKRA